MESDYHWLVTIGLVTSSILAITANTFLFVVFCKKRGLRTVPNRFVINLLVTNLLSSILLIPLLLADQESETTLTTVIQNNDTTISKIEQVFFTEEEEEIVKDKVLASTTREEDIRIIETSERVLTDKIQHIVLNSTNQKLLCYFAQSSTSFVCTASIFSILLIGVNQYFGVLHSLRYHFYINKWRSTVFIVTSWLVALLFAVLSSLTYTNNSLWHFCQKYQHKQSSDTVRIFNTVFAFSYFVVVILAPFVAICVIYVCIYTAAHKNSERMRKSTSAANTTKCLEYIQVPVSNDHVVKIDHLSVIEERKSLPKVHSAPNFTQLVKEDSFSDITILESDNRKNKVARTCSERSTNRFINTLKHKISNASVFRYREETRAAKISILVIFMVLICYIPYGITLVLNSDYINIRTSQIFHYLSLILLIFSNITSPFLFGYRNKRVKREIGKIFGIVPASGHHHSFPVMERATKRQSMIVRNRSFEDIHEHIINEPFLPHVPSACGSNDNNYCNSIPMKVPEVVITCKPETERKSILKRVCNSSNWPSYKKCNFITVPDSCISGEARGSFSSASTQISSEE